MRNIALALAILGLAVSARAESRAKKVLLAPVREIKRTAVDLVTFRSKPFSVAGLAYLTAYGVDMYSTARSFRLCDTCVENGPFANGTRSMMKLSLSWGALSLANLTISHAVKTETPKSLRWSWPIGMIEQSAGHAAAAYRNYQYPILATPETKRACPASIAVVSGTCTY